MIIPDRICKNPHCEQQFTPTDQRQVYHSRKCQQDWNNYKAKLIRDQQKPVTSALNKNHRILARILNGADEKMVSRDFLLGAGFNLGIFAFRKQVNNRPYFGIFNFGFYQLENGKYHLIKF